MPVRAIAPEDAATHFGWLGMFFGMDMAASSTVTQQRFGWSPTGPTLAEDLSSGSYFSS